MSTYRKPRDGRAALARRHRRDCTQRHEEPIRRKERRPAPKHLRYLGRAMDALRLLQWQ
jgi:hypothetical protein